MFFNGGNKNYLNKHKSLMFNGYEANKNTVFNYTHNNLLTQNNEQNNYKRTQNLERYDIVVNKPSTSKLNRHTDFRKKYYGFDVNSKQESCFCDEENKKENESVFEHDFNPFNNTSISTQNSIKENKKVEIVVENNKNPEYETDKEIKTNLSFDRWQSSNDVFNQIKEVEKKLELLRTNMELDKVERSKQEKKKQEIKIQENNKKAVSENKIVKNQEHPYKKISKTFIEGDNVQICWTPNKWVDGVIDEVTIGGLYYIRHMTERENNFDAEMTWTRSLVNSNQIRRK